MGDVEPPVNCALERPEHAVASCRAHKADVKHGSERTRSILVLNKEHLAINLSLALVRIVEPKLLEKAAGAQQACKSVNLLWSAMACYETLLM